MLMPSEIENETSLNSTKESFHEIFSNWLVAIRNDYDILFSKLLNENSKYRLAYARLIRFELHYIEVYTDPQN